MPKMTLEEIKGWLGTYVNKAKMAAGTFVPTYENTIGLLDKIGKQLEITSDFSDNLPELEGEYLDFGKTVEEYHNDLVMPQDYDDSGVNALAPHYGTHRPVSWSTTLGMKTFPAPTIKQNDFERACLSAGDYTRMITSNMMVLANSVSVYRAAMKRQILANFASMAYEEQNATDLFATSTAFAVNKCLKKAGDSTVRGIVTAAIASSNSLTWAQLVANGIIIELSLTQTIAAPIDEETGAAFVKQIKKDVEIAKDVSEGHSLNGNTLGATPTEGLYLYVSQGVLPTLDVDTLAGAINQERLAIPATVKAIKDFGNDASGIFAILIDVRGVKLHNSYNATLSDNVAKGAYVNIYRHTEDTAFGSRNVFVKIYYKA